MLNAARRGYYVFATAGGATGNYNNQRGAEQ